MEKRYVIIVAGGSGSRMGTNIPKQFLLLKGLPVLMHTIRCFCDFNEHIDIIVTLPETEIARWLELCNEYNFTIKHTIIKGGETRFQSVKNALGCINEKSLVAVHDGVRPLVSHATIERCFTDARRTGASIPVIECFESIRQVMAGKNTAVDRSLFRLVQTPQIFDSEILITAYNRPYQSHFTDDASVIEYDGHSISLVEGNRENIKITTPQDLIIAEALLKTRDLF